ncbi:hypothetical protein D9756_007030 [Leucocoprinus leucothites]|uniref:RING-type domain-containing protein n=1 Tax=Leucocoprinus leucothites TaxID=201217 RepID=A0A8H5D5I1_9AGAR|nr:hypothetical protein D9756_007030 [Leucoagaricus leucothites]
MPITDSVSPSSSAAVRGRSRALQLRLEMNNGTTAMATTTTSASTSSPFKRSFEELFGPDSDEEGGEEEGSTRRGAAASNVTTGANSGTGIIGELGGARNGIVGRGRGSKRQRSGTASTSGTTVVGEASFSSSSSSSAGSNSGTSSVFTSPASSSRVQQPYHAVRRSSFEMEVVAPSSLPPRLPTPRLDDVQMSDIPLLDDDENLNGVTTTTTTTTTTGLPGIASSASEQGAREGLLLRDLEDDSGLTLPRLVQRSGGVSGSVRRHLQQQQQPQSTSTMDTTRAANQPPTIPLALPAPIPISIPPPRLQHAPVPNIAIPSTPPSLPLIEASSPAAAASSSTMTTVLDFRSSPSPPLPLSLTLSPQANVNGNTNQRGGSINHSTAIATSTAPSDSGTQGDRFRATMERYTEFENAMAALRRSVSPVLPPLLHGAARSDLGHGHAQRRLRPQAQASPPRLPPLELSIAEEGLAGNNDNDDEREALQVEGTMNPRGHGLTGRGDGATLNSSHLSAGDSTTSGNDNDERDNLSRRHHHRPLHSNQHHSHIHQIQRPTMSDVNSSAASAPARNFSLPSSFIGSSGSVRTQTRTGGLLDEEVDAPDGDEDEEQFIDDDGDDNESVHSSSRSDHRHAAPTPISVGSTANTYSRTGSSVPSSIQSLSTRAAAVGAAVRDAGPPRIELQLSGTSGGFGRGVIDEDEADEHDEDGEEEEEGQEREAIRGGGEVGSASTSSSSTSSASIRSSTHDPPLFRDRLDSALEALRSPSSLLVPGLSTSVTTATDDNVTTNHTTATTNNNGNATTGNGREAEERDQMLRPPPPRVSGPGVSSSQSSTFGFTSVADLIRFASGRTSSSSYGVEDDDDEGRIDILGRFSPPVPPPLRSQAVSEATTIGPGAAFAPDSSSTSTSSSSSSSGLASVANLIRTVSNHRRSRGSEVEGEDEEDERGVYILDRFPSPPLPVHQVPVTTNSTAVPAPSASTFAGSVSTASGGFTSVIDHIRSGVSPPGNPRVTVSSSTNASHFNSSTYNSNSDLTNANANMTALVSSSSGYPLSIPGPTPAMMGGFTTSLQPPTLPPIMTDAHMNDYDDYGAGRMWELHRVNREFGRGSTRERRDEFGVRESIRGQGQVSGIGQVMSGGEGERGRMVQSQSQSQSQSSLPEVPSPSLSGFYDWLDSASTTVGVASAAVGGAPTATATADQVSTGGHDGGSAVVSTGSEAVRRGDGVGAEASSSSGSSSSTGSELGSWEENFLSGLMTTDLGLNLALPQQRQEQQQRESGQQSSGDRTTVPSTHRQRTTTGSDVMDVDMESDTERGREVERLPWTLGVPTTTTAAAASPSSSSSSRAPPRLEFPRIEARRARLPSSRRHVTRDSNDDGWNPVHSARQWHGQAGPSSAAYTLPSASASLSSLPTTTTNTPLTGFSSSLFSSQHSPPRAPPSTRNNASPAINNHNSRTSSSSSRVRLPSLGTMTSQRSGAVSNERSALALPPSLSLDLGLRDSVFGTTTTDVTDGATSGAGTSVNATTATANVEASSGRQNNSLAQLFEPPAPAPSLSVPPPPAPRLPLFTEVTDYEHPRWYGSVNEREGNNATLRASSRGRRGSGGSGSGITTRVVGSDNSLVAENAVEYRRRRDEAIRRLNVRTGGSLSARNGESGGGIRERMGISGGLALPSRNEQGDSGSSLEERSGSGSMGSSMSVSMYPGVIPHPPRPRLHSVRQAHPPTSFAPPSGFTAGRRRSTSWSQGTSFAEDNSNNNHTSIENRRPPMAAQQAMLIMQGITLRPDGSGNGPVMRLYTEPEEGSGPQPQRIARTSVDSLSSGSSMSVDSFLDSGSGMSSTSVYGGGGEQLNPPARPVFLDTQLPSPGLGELFDTLGPNLSTTATRPATEPTQPAVTSLSAPTSAAAPSTTFASSASSGFPSAGRLTPSPVRTSDDDSEEGGMIHESARLRSLTERLGHMRDAMLSDMLRWDRDDESVLSDEIEVDGNASAINVIRLGEQRPPGQDLRRPDLFSPRPAAMNSTSSSSANASETRSGIIDPTLFAPGPFRNTIGFAARTREHTGPGASVRPPTSMSSPLAQFSPSSSSSLSPPPTYTLTAPSHPRVTSPQSPPVIPPLSFESNTHNEVGMSNPGVPRSEVQEPLGTTARQWIADSDEFLRRQQRMRNLLRSYQSGQLPSSALSASSSSVSSASSVGAQVSWSQLERSPERAESATGLPEPGIGSSGTHHSARGEAEGLHDAIRVLRGDGLSVDRSLQFLDRLRQQRAEGGMPGRVEGGERNQDQRRGGSRSQDEAIGRYLSMREREGQREARSNLSVPRWLHSNNPLPISTSQPGSSSTSGPSTARAPSATGVTPRNRSGYPNSDWRALLDNNAGNNTVDTEADMRRLQAFLENVSDSESESVANDEDAFMRSIAWGNRHTRPTTSSTSLSSASTTTSTTAIVGRNNDSNRHGRSRRQGRPTVDVRGNVTNAGMAGSLNQAENPVAGSGNGWPSVAARMIRDRAQMAHRLRGNSSNLFPETPTGGTGWRRPVGGFTRRFGELGDYLDDDEFDASYESLLALQDALGEVKQRSTPEAVLKKLKKGKFKEWAKEGAESRCPICLEDYEMEDDVLKSGNCPHWMHKPCLETWFKRANTCPVCRVDVEPRPAPSMRSRNWRGYIPRSNRWRNSSTSSGVATNAVGHGVGGGAGPSRSTVSPQSPHSGPSETDINAGFHAGSSSSTRGNGSSDPGNLEGSQNGNANGDGSFF